MLLGIIEDIYMKLKRILQKISSPAVIYRSGEQLIHRREGEKIGVIALYIHLKLEECTKCTFTWS